MKNVIVLFGGDSDEKEISKLSADSIINNIDTTKFDAQLLDLNNLNLKEVATSFKFRLFKSNNCASNFVVSILFIIESAESLEISFSSESPPKSTITFFIYIKL